MNYKANTWVTLSIMILTATLMTTLIGCVSKGFNRGELKEQTGIVTPTYNDTQIKGEFQKKANLPKPFKLAVYFKNPPDEKKNTMTEWRWTEHDKSIFEGLAHEMKAQGIVSDIFPIVSSVVNSDDLKSIRMAAAKHQADAVLIIAGAGQIDRYINGWGWTYTLLLPAFFVPGSQAETVFISNATLWDVRNEYLYLTAETEANTNEKYIAAFGKKDKDLVTEAKSTALNQLHDELRKMIKGTKF
ncbi:MAG: hypothetical protein JNL11_05740 [Bdellovibrionaceae bacterium]|nr:hypothetical protein [Pseudobdellovibrionaceae bacterium]